MLTFALRGSIADIDETLPVEPAHPTTVVVVATHEALTRVVVPRSLIDGFRQHLSVGQGIEVAGEVQDFPKRPVHVASEFRLARHELH